MKKSVFKGKLGNSIKAILMSGAVLFTALSIISERTSFKANADEEFLKAWHKYGDLREELIKNYFEGRERIIAEEEKGLSALFSEREKATNSPEIKNQFYQKLSRNSDLYYKELYKLDPYFEEADNNLYKCCFDVENTNKCVDNVMVSAKNSFDKVVKKAKELFKLRNEGRLTSWPLLFIYKDNNFATRLTIPSHSGKELAEWPLPAVNSNNDLVAHLESPSHSGKELAEYPLVR